jgi:hypothetical protein
MDCIGTLSPTVCPPPPPPPPPPPLTPAQLKCEFSLPPGGVRQGLQQGGGTTISLKSLPPGPFNLTDRIGDRYLVMSPCLDALDTASPALETWYSVAGKITLGLLSQLSTQVRPIVLSKTCNDVVLNADTGSNKPNGIRSPCQQSTTELVPKACG